MQSALRLTANIVLVALLTALTQVGGLAWLAAAFSKRRAIVFVCAYTFLSVASQWAAPVFGRTPLPCWGDGPLKVRSPAFCAMNRHYVTPELKAVLDDAANGLSREFPGTRTVVLDANFPFFSGFPLLPHLSHDDGEKADIALFYADASGYLPGKTRSPVGYFAFESGPSDCPKQWPSLRWDLSALQPLWPDYRLEPERTRAALLTLASDARVGKVFIEPHLRAQLDVDDSKIRFQGCRAARHDDHIHIQL